MSQTEPDVSLADKAIDIRGKKYVEVAQRIKFFNENYKSGMIQTKILSEITADRIVIMAKVTPNYTVPERFFTGLSQAKWGEGMVNKTAALENAETSAVGRALAMLGIGVLDTVASVDEMNKAIVDEDDAMDRAMLKNKCRRCGGEMVKNPKTGNWFCKNKCWTKYENNLGD